MKRDEKQLKIDALNDLVQVCKAGEFGFRLAAHEVNNKELRSLLLSAAIKRNEFAHALEEQIREFGGIPRNHASLEAGIHRTWMNLRHVINYKNDEVVLEECRRGEESALKTYQDVFEQEALPEIDPILKAQFTNVIETRDKLLNIIRMEPELKPTQTMLHL